MDEVPAIEMARPGHLVFKSLGLFHMGWAAERLAEERVLRPCRGNVPFKLVSSTGRRLRLGRRMLRRVLGGRSGGRRSRVGLRRKKRLPGFLSWLAIPAARSRS